MERNSSGRFIKGHKAIGGVENMLEYNRNKGVWIKGLTAKNDERVRKISECTRFRQTGKKFSKETREKMSNSAKGRFFSIETRKKLSESHKGKKLSQMHIEKLRLIHKGSKHTEEWKKKAKERMLKNNPFKGKTHSNETKKKISELSKGRKAWNKGIEYYQIKGDRHPNWRGGITRLIEAIRKSLKYRKWRDLVFIRDNYKCKICDKVFNKLNAHHKKSFSELIQENNITTLDEAMDCVPLWNLDNGETLCIECHKKTDNYGFNNLNSVICKQC